MSLTVRLEWHANAGRLSDEQHIRSKLQGLERRLVNHPEPQAIVSISDHPMQRLVDVGLRVQLGPFGPTLVSHESGPTVDAAIGQAVRDVERQLERHHGKQRGEPSFGVPSRRRLVIAESEAELSARVNATRNRDSTASTPLICPNCGGSDLLTEPSLDTLGEPTGAIRVTCRGCGRDLRELPPLEPNREMDPADRVDFRADEDDM